MLNTKRRIVTQLQFFLIVNLENLTLNCHIHCKAFFPKDVCRVKEKGIKNAVVPGGR